MIAQFGFPDGVVVETLGRAEAFVGIDVVESSAGFFAARSRRKPAELLFVKPVEFSVHVVHIELRKLCK